MNLKKVHIKIVGRVQGVFYRVSLQQQAKALGITGWCRNMPDGSVEAVIAGDNEAVQGLIDWCWQGPSGAEVRDVQVQDEVLSAYEMPECAFEVYR